MILRYFLIAEPTVVYPNGTKFWMKNGKLHRAMGLPAVIYASGSRSWHVNGNLHRGNDLPAVLDIRRISVVKEHHPIVAVFLLLLDRPTTYSAIEEQVTRSMWWKHGRLHRENGPALIAGGRERFFKDGIEVK